MPNLAGELFVFACFTMSQNSCPVTTYCNLSASHDDRVGQQREADEQYVMVKDYLDRTSY